LVRAVRDAVAKLDVQNVPGLCRQALEQGIPAHRLVMEGIAKGMEILGQEYERGELFVSELILAGEMAKEAMAIIEPYLAAGGSIEVESGAKVVIGTVEGDMHDLGKNLVATLLRAVGFQVADLGSDVPVRRFSEKVREVGAGIVAMSALLTTTMVNMEKVILDLEENNIRNSVKVIIGGAPVDSQFALKIHADAAARDALQGVQICKNWSK
jgi:methanogenic corrinoid protein MtbC1